MLHSKLQHSAILLITLIAIALSSVSVATPASQLQIIQTIEHSNQLEASSQHHALPCNSITKAGIAADFPCSDSSKHTDHCASCTPIYAALPTVLDIKSHQSKQQKYTDLTESIPNITLPNLSRPPIQSVWF